MFRSSVLYASNSELISIKYIESILMITPEDDVINALKDDIIFQVSLISGKIHSISVKKQMEIFELPGIDKTLGTVYLAIIERWGRLIDNISKPT